MAFPAITPSNVFLPSASSTGCTPTTLFPFDYTPTLSPLPQTGPEGNALMPPLSEHNFLHQNDGDALHPQQLPKQPTSSRGCLFDSTMAAIGSHSQFPGHTRSTSSASKRLPPIPIERITPHYVCASSTCSARFAQRRDLEYVSEDYLGNIEGLMNQLVHTREPSIRGSYVMHAQSRTHIANLYGSTSKQFTEASSTAATSQDALTVLRKGPMYEDTMKKNTESHIYLGNLG